MVIETKTKKAVAYLACGNVKEALKLFKSFRHGWTKEEKRLVDSASDCLCGMSEFYQSIGIDCDKVVTEAVSMITSKYGIESQNNLHI